MREGRLHPRLMPTKYRQNLAPNQRQIQCRERQDSPRRLAHDSRYDHGPASRPLPNHERAPLGPEARTSADLASIFCILARESTYEDVGQ